MSRHRDRPRADRAPIEVPPFRPHRFWSGGHAQTVIGRYLYGARAGSGGTEVRFPLPDEEGWLTALESRPAHWVPGEPMAVLVHGLCGCAQANYLLGLSDRLVRLGVRTLRLNLRNAGSGFGLARGAYHAGRSGDLRAAVSWLGEQVPGSPIALIGFSLGASLSLRLAAEASEEPVPGLDCVLAASPPLDLHACCRFLTRRGARAYDRNFVRLLSKEVARLHDRFPDLGPVDLTGVRTLYEFDGRYTAPRHGYHGADDYYAKSSAGPMLGRVVIPGLIVHALDDPFIPPEAVRSVECTGALKLELLPAGGHLGFISQGAWAGDRRWLDTRLAAWLADHWGLPWPG
jgi:predicted alpha/beta-fold hydrolase